MPDEFSFATRFLLCSLALWRLTHLIVAEDGPWDIIVKLRVRLGDTQAGRAMDCFYCTSLWLAIPFTFVVARHLLEWLISWFSLSGAAALLEQATNRDINRSHPPSSKDEEKK